MQRKQCLHNPVIADGPLGLGRKASQIEFGVAHRQFDTAGFVEKVV